MAIVFTNADIQRFLNKISSMPHEGCWLWAASVDNHGYGAIGLGKNRVVKAHRFSYAYFKEDPGRLVVRHTCDTPACVNPLHLLAGTQADNIADREARQRRKPLIGSAAARAVLSEDDIPLIRRRAQLGEPLIRIAEDYGVARKTICAVVHNKTWRHVAMENI